MKKFTLPLFFFFIAVFNGSLNAQNVGINSTGTAPDASAMLDVSSTNKGILIPRIALTGTGDNTTISFATTGLLIYNTTAASSGSTAVFANTFYYWNGSAWVALSGSGGKDWSLTGNAGTTAGTNFIGTTDPVDFVVKTNNAEAARVTSGGKVGIGLTPSMKLDVTDASTTANNATIRGSATGAAKTYGVYGTTTSTTGNASGVKGEANGAGAVNGVWGSSSSTSGTGVYGSITATTGSNTGVVGTTASASGMGVYGSINSSSFIAGVGVEGMVASTVTNGTGVAGICDNATGTGVYGSSTGTNAYGVYGKSTSATGYGMRAQNSNISGTGISASGNGVSGSYLTSGSGGAFSSNNVGVYGYGDNTTNSYGVLGVSDNASGQGIAGRATASTGIGVTGFGNNLSTYWNINSAGCGASFSGSRYGVESCISDESTQGTEYTYNTTYATILGFSQTNTSTSRDTYHFGIQGSNNDYGTAYSRRSGGVLGQEAFGASWGCLGYQSSTNANRYGVYGSAAYTSGAGFLTDNSKMGIASGFYGSLIGGWSRGEVMGHISTGELFSSYNLGDEYTSGHQIELVETNNEKTPAYSVTSTEIKIYADGKAELINGTASVKFSENFIKLLGDNPNITVTPIGESEGLHIKEITKTGFTVKENKNGNSSVLFTWIAVGNRIDDKDKSAIPADLTDKNFDKNMKEVMFNESDTKHSAKSIWWDGSKIRFDDIYYKAKKEPFSGKILLDESKLKTSTSLTNPKEIEKFSDR